MIQINLYNSSDHSLLTWLKYAEIGTSICFQFFSHSLTLASGNKNISTVCGFLVHFWATLNKRVLYLPLFMNFQKCPCQQNPWDNSKDLEAKLCI